MDFLHVVLSGCLCVAMAYIVYLRFCVLRLLKIIRDAHDRLKDLVRKIEE